MEGQYPISYSIFDPLAMCMPLLPHHSLLQQPAANPSAFRAEPTYTVRAHRGLSAVLSCTKWRLCGGLGEAVAGKFVSCRNSFS